MLIACSADAPAADLSAEELFGVREVLAEVRTDGVRLVAGYAPARGGFDGEVDFVLAGAVRDGDDWRVRLVEPLMGGTCGANTVERLVPDEPSIVATCLTGGTNRVGYVAVLGTDPRTSLPDVMLVLSCGVTWAEVDGRVLRIRSTGPQAAAHLPGPLQPDIEFEWENGRLDTPDWEAMRTYCQPDEFYDGES